MIAQPQAPLQSPHRDFEQQEHNSSNTAAKPAAKPERMGKSSRALLCTYAAEWKESVGWMLSACHPRREEKSDHGL